MIEGNSIIFVVAGPSGAGKGSIVKRLVELDDQLWLSRSWTTRPQRSGERADAYHFVDNETFLAHVDAGGFLEWAEVFDHLYGTPLPEPISGKDVLLEIDVQGAQQVRAGYPDSVMIFVEPPSRSEQRRRLRGRGDDESLIRRRLAKADAEEEIGRKLADIVVVNDELDRAVGEVLELIRGVRISRSTNRR